MKLCILAAAFAAAALTIAGCGQRAAPAPSSGTTAGEPIGVQLLRVVPELKSQRFSSLLSFESPNDQVFVGAPGGSIAQDDALAHAGGHSLRLEPGTGTISIKLSSLRAADSLPGNWTLVGAYFFVDKQTEIAATCTVGGGVIAQNRVRLPPGAWTPVMIDISGLKTGLIAPDAVILLNFELAPSAKPIWCDDVVLIENTQTIVAGDPNDSMAWTIRRRGLNIIGEVTGRFRFALVAREYAPLEGWTVREANPLRARFASDGKTQALTIYSDGRAYWDGEFRPMGDATRTPALAEAHLSPAQVDVPEELGRVDRNTPGDANNDGYNELLGAYQIIATGPRLEVKLTPRSAALLKPVLEITGLPSGRILVTVEGRLLEKTVRLDNGTLLVEIPARIERPTTISFRAQ